jgi:hypothetical protein
MLMVEGAIRFLTSECKELGGRGIHTLYLQNLDLLGWAVIFLDVQGLGELLPHQLDESAPPVVVSRRLFLLDVIG